MDFIFPDYWYRNVENISQSPAQSNVTQESFLYEEDAFTQMNENQSLFENESDFMAFWNKNYLNCNEQGERKQASNAENNSQERDDLNDLDEILNHVPCLPSCLKSSGGEKMNFFMIATSLDEQTIMENLETIFDKTEFRALPLSFDIQGRKHMVMLIFLYVQHISSFVRFFTTHVSEDI